MTYSNKTKLVSIIMLVSLVLSLFAGISIPSGTTVFAEEVDYSDVYEFNSETGTIEGFKESYLSSHEGESLAVVIPATIGDVAVTAIGDYAFYFYENGTYSQPMEYNVTITSVDFSDASNLISIGTSAFRYTNITSLDFSGATKLESIGSTAFSQSDIAGTLTIPNTITSVGAFAFSSCENLTKVYLGSGDYEISNQMFQDCSGIEYIIFDDNNQITTIGNDAFRNCTSLKVLVLPEGIEYIEKEALFGLTGLEWLYIANADFKCIKIDNDTDEVSDLTFINLSTPSGLHIVAANADDYETLTAIPDDGSQVGSKLWSCSDNVTYEMTVSFDGLDDTYDRTVLYNFPINYVKITAEESGEICDTWEADSSYTLPTSTTSGAVGWNFDSSAVVAITESTKVSGATLYPITLEFSAIYSGNIAGGYTGESYSVVVTPSLEVNNEVVDLVEYGEVGYFVLYTYYSYGYDSSIGSWVFYDMVAQVNTTSSLEYTESNSWEFTNVSESTGSYYGEIYINTYVVYADLYYYDGETLEYLADAGFNIYVKITQAEPTVEAYEDGVTDGLLADYFYEANGVAGEFAFTDSDSGEVTTLASGENTYNYTFTPEDTENYTTATDSVTITGKAEQKAIVFESDVTTLEFGETLDITAIYDSLSEGEEVDSTDIVYSIDNEDIASLDGATLEATALGTVTITATKSGGDEYAAVRVSKTIEIVDTTAPEVTDNSTISYSTWNGASTISVTLEDNIGVVNYILEINGEEVASREDQSSGVVVEYEFETSGSYVYTLTVTDGSGSKTVYEKTVYIETAIDEFNALAEDLDEESSAADLVIAENYYNALTSTQKLRVALTGSEEVTSIIGANDVSQGYYDNMVKLIADNAQDILDGKTAALEDAIEDAIDDPTADSFATVISLYNSYAAEDESIISGLADESAADYADILAVSEVASLYATSPTNYTRLSSLVTAYEALSDDAKSIAVDYDITIGTVAKTLTEWYTTYVGYKTNIDDFMEEVNEISSITADNYDDVKELVAVYADVDDSETTLTAEEQALISTAVKTTLAGWNEIIARVDNVETLIASEDLAVTIDSSNVADFVSALIAAENAYDALSEDEQALVTGDLAAAQAKYEDYLEDLEDAANYAEAVAFQKQVASVIANSPTISDIDTIYAEYVALDSEVADYIAATTITSLEEYSAASTALVATAVELTDNTEYTTLVDVLADIQTGEIAITDFSYADLGVIYNTADEVSDEKQTELLSNTYGSEISEIDSAFETLGDFKELIDALIDDGVTAESDTISDENIVNIENAKILYLALSEDELALLGNTTVGNDEGGYLTYAEYIIAVYAHMVEYVDTEIIYQADVSAEDEDERNVVVYGLATKVDVEEVQDYATSSSEDTLTIEVVAVETQTTIEESSASEYVEDGYEKLVSYEIKLVAYVNDNEPEIVQPAEGESVVVDIPLGSIADTSSIVIYHVSDDGSVSVMAPTFYTSGGITYARATITSFSEFIVTNLVAETAATTTSSSSSSSSVSLDQSAPVITVEGDIATVYDANLYAITVGGEEVEITDNTVVIDLAEYGDGVHEIVATDKYRRSTTETVTVSIASVPETPAATEAPVVTETPAATVAPEVDTDPTTNGGYAVWIILAVIAIGVVGYVVYKKKQNK